MRLGLLANKNLILSHELIKVELPLFTTFRALALHVSL